MTKPPPTFQIHESRTGDSVRLSLVGELDIATAPILEDRLTRLRARRSPVHLDFAKLTFIDSSGVHLLVRMVGDAHARHWPLQIEPDVPTQVLLMLKLTHLERIVGAPSP